MWGFDGHRVLMLWFFFVASTSSSLQATRITNGRTRLRNFAPVARRQEFSHRHHHNGLFGVGVSRSTMQRSVRVNSRRLKSIDTKINLDLPSNDVLSAVESKGTTTKKRNYAMPRVVR